MNPGIGGNKLRIDPHVHLPTQPDAMLADLQRYSKDFDAIVVTQPGSADPAWQAEKMVKEHNLPLIIIPGAEVMSSEGTIISVIGAVRHGIIYSGYPAHKIINDIHKYGGLAGLMHAHVVERHLAGIDAVQTKEVTPIGVHAFGKSIEFEGTATTDEEVLALLRNRPKITSHWPIVSVPKLVDTEYVKDAVSIVMPIHNCPDFLKLAVDSLVTTNWPKLELVLVDNASTDKETIKLLKQYKKDGHTVIFRKVNDGFSHSVNVGCRATKAEFVVLFNQDAAIIDPEWVRHMVNMFRDKPRCGVQGVKLLYPGTNIIQHIGIVYPPNNTGTHRFLQTASEIPVANVSCAIAGVTGAVFAIRHSVFDALGGLSQQYTMGCEDSDFCFQTWTKLGMEVWFNHKVVCTHFDNGIKKRTPGAYDMATTSGWGFTDRWAPFLRTLPEQNPHTKIAFVLPDSGLAGGSRVIFTLLNHLVIRGYNACLYTLDGSRPQDFEVLFDTYPFHDLQPNSNTVLVATRFDTAYQITGLPAKKKLYAVQHHEVIMAEQCGATEDYVKGSYAFKDLEIVTIGTHLQDILKAHYGRNSNIVDVGIDLTLFNAEQRKEYKGPVRILFYGAGKSVWKGYYDCLDVLGRTAEKYGDKVQISSFYKNMAPPEVPWLHRHYQPFNQEELANIYKEHDILLYLSHGEGFGLISMEALASKCAVVISNHTGMQQWSEDGKNCLVSKYKDNDDAFEKLCRMIDHPKLRQKLAKAGHETMRRYEWGLVVNQWIPYLLGIK